MSFPAFWASTSVQLYMAKIDTVCQQEFRLIGPCWLSVASFRSEYEYKIEYKYTFQISNHVTSPELSLFPFVYQQIRRL